MKKNSIPSYNPNLFSSSNVNQEINSNSTASQIGQSQPPMFIQSTTPIIQQQFPSYQAQQIPSQIINNKPQQIPSQMINNQAQQIPPQMIGNQNWQFGSQIINNQAQPRVPLVSNIKNNGNASSKPVLQKPPVQSAPQMNQNPFGNYQPPTQSNMINNSFKMPDPNANNYDPFAQIQQPYSNPGVLNYLQQPPPQLGFSFGASNNAMQQQQANLLAFQAPQINNAMQQQQANMFPYQSIFNQQQTSGNKQSSKDKHNNSRLIEDPIKEINLEKAKELSSIDFNFEQQLKLQIEAPYNFYKVNSQNSLEIPIKISLKALENSMEIETDLSNRSAIDLICVVDVSGSMGGHKLELVKKTLKYIISILKDSDRFALIIFDDQGEMLISLKQIADHNKQLFNDIINELKDRGGTVINSGVKLALDLIKNRKYKNPITSIFLLSDGVDNEQHKAIYTIQNTIKVSNIIENFTISSFGFGQDHDANLMREIAKSQGGNFYYIDDLNSIDECFVDALGILFSVILKDIEFFIKINNTPPLTDMRVKKTYGDMWSYDDQKGGQKIITKVFTAGMSKDYICEVNVPPCKKPLQDHEKKRVIISVVMTGKTVKDEIIERKADLALNLLNSEDPLQGPNELNVEVLVNHFRVKGAEKLENVKNLAEMNKFDEARMELNGMKKELEECVCKDHPALVVLKSDIENTINICQPQRYNNSAKSYIASYANNNMYQQSCPMQNAGHINNYYANKCQMNMNVNLKNSKK